MNLKWVCRRILEIHSAIASVEMVTADGQLLATEQDQKRLAKILPLTKDESELLLMQSLMRMDMRKTLAYKLGEPIYSLTEYEKVKRAAVIWKREKEKGGEAVITLLMSKNAEFQIILPKMLAILSEVLAS